MDGAGVLAMFPCVCSFRQHFSWLICASLGTGCMNLRRVDYSEILITVNKTVEFKCYLLQVSCYCCNIYTFTV